MKMSGNNLEGVYTYGEEFSLLNKKEGYAPSFLCSSPKYSNGFRAR